MISGKLILVLVFTLCQARTDIEDNGVYGRDWVVFIDDNGMPHRVDLYIPPMAYLEDRVHTVSPSEPPRFWLYTRKAINDSEELFIPVQNKTNYNPEAPLVVLVHGWLCNRDSDSVQFIKNAILTTANRNDNVIIMDWSNMQSWNYIFSAKETLDAAEKLKEFVQSLTNIYHVSGSQIHFIGHSLGAHVVGLAGGKLKENNLIVSRITGLDPAKPFFELLPIFPTITKDSAEFVDIIHTSTGTLGICNRAGHADFYPGGGVNQPAVCPPSIFPGTCEHGSAYIYFQKSFTRNFEARKCINYFMYTIGLCEKNEVRFMGEPCNSTARGSYFIDIETINMK